jgi:hypothetical protein
VAAPGTLVNEAEVLTPAQQVRLAAARHSDSTIAIIKKAEAGGPSSRPPGTGLRLGGGPSLPLGCRRLGRNSGAGLLPGDDPTELDLGGPAT